MNKLVFAIALFSIVPALRAQQAETNPPQAASQPASEAAPQPTAQNPSAQDNLPASLRPGHPLDPADVDILTGKRGPRNRGITESRSAIFSRDVRILRRSLRNAGAVRQGVRYSDASADAHR